jgi:D-lactate dehydrogenase
VRQPSIYLSFFASDDSAPARNPQRPVALPQLKDIKIAMKICLLETEVSEQLLFETALDGRHELVFASNLGEGALDAEIFCLYIHTLVTATVLDQYRKVELIATRSMGYDHIDIEECTRRGITVANVPGTDANTVAEHTFALMLALSRRLNEVRAANKQAKFSYERLRGFDLKDKTLGILGTGRIGLRVAHIALAFGMEVIAYEPYQPSLMAEIVGVQYVPFDDLLSRSHVISLHTPLTPETLHIIDGKAFAKMRRGVVLINTARGALIDTVALIEALNEGIVAAAGLDVLEEESVMRKDAMKIITERIVTHLQTTSSEEYSLKNPERIRQLQALMDNTKLLARSNVVFTPHVAFNSIEAVQRINALTVKNIEAYAQGEPTNVVNKNVRSQRTTIGTSVSP